MAEKQSLEYVAQTVYQISYTNSFIVPADSMEDALKKAEEIEPDVEWDSFWEQYTVVEKKTSIIGVTPEKDRA